MRLGGYYEGNNCYEIKNRRKRRAGCGYEFDYNDTIPVGENVA